MSRSKGNFIDFILDAQKDQILAGEFLQQKTAKQLADFFEKHHYLGIEKDDPRKIIKAKNNFAKGFNQGFGGDYY